jgi:hypothetical protein
LATKDQKNKLTTKKPALQQVFQSLPEVPGIEPGSQINSCVVRKYLINNNISCGALFTGIHCRSPKVFLVGHKGPQTGRGILLRACSIAIRANHWKFVA